MSDEITELDLKAIKDLILMHEDVMTALGSLPDFGYATPKNLSDIQQAQEMVKKLRNTLEHFIYTKNTYHETYNNLLKLLTETGVSKCVDALVNVSRNSRKIAKNEVSNPKNYNDVMSGPEEKPPRNNVYNNFQQFE